MHGGRRHPATIHAAGQHLSDVLAHLLVDQPVQLGIHGHEQVGVLLPIHCEVVEFVRVVLVVEQLDVVQFEQFLDRGGTVMLLGREVTRELVAAVEHAADGTAFH